MKPVQRAWGLRLLTGTSLVVVLAGIASINAQAPATAQPVRPAAAQSESPRAANGMPQPDTANVVDAAPAPAPLPVELQPYRVRIETSFALDSSLLPQQRQAVLTELNEQARRSTGAMWQLQIDEARDQPLHGPDALERATPEQMLARTSQGAFDKVYLLAVDAWGAGYRLSGREWDTATGQLSAVRRKQVYRRNEIATGWLLLIRDLFVPLAIVEQSRTGAVAVRARAGELVPPDQGWAPLQKDQIFELYHRFTGSKAAAAGPQRVPWTYLVVEQVERGRGACRLLTGLRAPLSARRRVETLAVGIRRDVPSTRLSLLTTRPAPKPVVGTEVDVVTDPEQPPQRLVSDRAGAIEIKAGAGLRQVWLYIRSGQALLAKLPIVPGVRAAESVELPDDSLRLHVEGELSILQAALVDAVARRAMVTASARASAKSGDWKQTATSLTQLDELPGRANFAARLNAVRLPALQEARDQKLPDAAARIKKLCDETEALIARYLNEAKIRDVRDEIEELRKTTAEDIAAEADEAARTKKKQTRRPSPPAKPAANDLPAQQTQPNTPKAPEF